MLSPKKSTLRLPGLSLDFARNGEPVEPKAWACSGLTLSRVRLPRLKRRGLAPPNGSKRFYLDFSGLMVASGLLFCAVFLGDRGVMGQPGMNTYPTNPPGQTQRLERPYKDAPPLIPHSVEGLGITRSSNDCLVCHSEGMEVEKGHVATKVPPSHYVNEYSGEQKKEQVLGERYNCTQCHVPQSQEEPPVIPKR